jgi:hypothetical protein
MELRESADGLRWAIGRTGAMAVIWMQIAKIASRAVRKTEPDLRLIKQAELVSRWFWRDQPGALQNSEHRIAVAVEVLVFHEFGNYCSTVIPLQKTAVTAGRGRGRLVCEGQSGNTAVPTRRFHEPP